MHSALEGDERNWLVVEQVGMKTQDPQLRAEPCG